MNDIIKNIRDTLIENRDEKTLSNGQNYFKEKIQFYGVKTITVTKISKDCFSLVSLKNKEEIFGLCEQLFQSGYLEESFIACNWSYYICDRYEEEDIFVFERWVDNYVNNWATCDTLCNHSVGTFVEMYPHYIHKLKGWATSENRWKKRAAAVTLIIPARKGLFEKEIFEIADILLTDKDDMVQKGYGWMLKAYSQSNQKAVFDYAMKKKKIMPRTALRYAIEKMPPELRKEAMAK